MDPPPKKMRSSYESLLIRLTEDPASHRVWSDCAVYSLSGGHSDESCWRAVVGLIVRDKYKMPVGSVTVPCIISLARKPHGLQLKRQTYVIRRAESQMTSG